MTSATIFVEGVFRDGYEQHFAEYSRQVKAYLNQYDAKVVRRQRITKTLYGVNTLSLIMLIDFASREVAEQIFFAPDYLALIPLRDKVFAEFRMYLAEPGEI